MMLRPYRLPSSRGEARRAGPVVAFVASLPLLLAGCSFHLGGLGEDAPEDVTGSIGVRPATRFPPDLTGEDLRRAKGALAVALDPQGNGRAVGWDNRESGNRGEIVPAGSPFVEAEEICRRFTAATTLASGRTSALAGQACRLSADEWEIRALRPS